MISFFSQAFESKIVLSLLIAWVASQTIKGILFSISNRNIKLKYFLAGEGGMPSSHSTFVSALFISVYMEEGLSTSFLIALSFGLVIIRDAVGVRQETANHARILNRIMPKVYSESHESPNDLSELVGHTFVEVLVGFFVAFVSVQLVFHYL